jgi:hypothetical protein
MKIGLDFAVGHRAPAANDLAVVAEADPSAGHLLAVRMQHAPRLSGTPIGSCP